VGTDSDGISLLSSERNSVQGNTVIDHESSGLRAQDETAGILSRALRIGGNRFIANRGETINLENVTDSTFDGNLLRGNGDSVADEVMDFDGETTGGAPNGSVNNRIQNNRLEGNESSGITLRADSRENIVQDNIVRANDENGIVVLGDAEDNVVRRNTASENGADNVDAFRDAGILVFDPVDGNEVPDVVGDNVANLNGFLNADFDDNGFGIAIGDDTAGSGNTAKGNDNPAECDPNIFC
jgi:parallel beta-helix repeat protein